MPSFRAARRVPFTPRQMFDLVADVERYPEFLPWCLGCRVVSRAPGEIRADLLIGFRVFRERWHSRVLLDRPRQIDVEYVHGPFRHLENRWRFEPHPEGCLVDFYVDFEFRSKLLSRVIAGLFGEAVHHMVRAFETRARAIYGAPKTLESFSPTGR